MRASSSLLVLAAAAMTATLASAQLQPQYLAPSPPTTVSCFDADSLVWRSIPGKIVVEGPGRKPKAKPKPVPPLQAPPAAHIPGPDEEILEAEVAVTAQGGVAAAMDRQAVDAAAAVEQEQEEEDKAGMLPPPLPASIQIKALNWFGLDRCVCAARVVASVAGTHPSYPSSHT